MSARQFWNGFGKGMKSFGHTINAIINTVLLTSVYFIGVGTSSLAAKITRKHFLDTKFSNQESYWIELDIKKKPMKEYYRQF